MVTVYESFADELQKIAFKLNPQGKAEAHFLAEKPDWKDFERNLKSEAFRKAIAKAEQADPKLRKYVKTFGEYKGSKDELARIKSKDSGKTYAIKALPSGRWGCNCGDWQYHHSVNGGDCKHVKSVKQSKMVKTGGVLGAVAQSGLQASRLVGKTEKLRDQGRAAKAAKLQARAPGPVPLTWKDRLHPFA
jgi:hypothetical protein